VISTSLSGIRIHFPQQAESELCLTYETDLNRVGGRQPVPDLATLLSSGSYRLRFPNLLVKNSREPKNHLKSVRNLVID
jgi:hypothetical protein